MGSSLKFSKKPENLKSPPSDDDSLISNISNLLGDNSNSFLLHFDSFSNKNGRNDSRGMESEKSYDSSVSQSFERSVKPDEEPEDSINKDEFLLRDLLPNLLPPLPITDYSKRFAMPRLPSILERSCEDGALNITSQSRSQSSSRCSVSIDMEAVNNIVLPVFEQSVNESDHLAERPSGHVAERQRDTNLAEDVPKSFSTQGSATLTQTVVKPTKKSQHEVGLNASSRPAASFPKNGTNPIEKLNRSDISMDRNSFDFTGKQVISVANNDEVFVDSWDEFDNVMEKSFAPDSFRSLAELSTIQKSINVCDSEFKCLTAEEAKQLIDNDEKDRLKLLNSTDGSFSGVYNNDISIGPNGTITDKNISFGEYFYRRSSNPLKIQANESSMFHNKTLDLTTYSVSSRRLSSSNIPDRPSQESLKVERRLSDAAMTPRLENSVVHQLEESNGSINSLAQFFVGPESNGMKPEAMMDYILEYCKTKNSNSTSEQLAPNNTIKNDSSADSAKNAGRIKNRSKNDSESSAFVGRNSSGTSSLDSSKTLTPSNSLIKQSLQEVLRTCDKQESSIPLGKEHDSMVISNYGSACLMSETDLFDHSEVESNENLYRKFKEDLMLSCLTKPLGNGDVPIKQSTYLNMNQCVDRRTTESDSLFLHPSIINASNISAKKRLSIEQLRKGARTPPERLGDVTPVERDFSTSSLLVKSGGAHSTPMQESMTATMVKSLGLEDLMNKAKSMSRRDSFLDTIGEGKNVDNNSSHYEEHSFLDKTVLTEVPVVKIQNKNKNIPSSFSKFISMPTSSSSMPKRKSQNGSTDSLSSLKSNKSNLEMKDKRATTKRVPVHSLSNGTSSGLEPGPGINAPYPTPDLCSQPVVNQAPAGQPSPLYPYYGCPPIIIQIQCPCGSHQSGTHPQVGSLAPMVNLAQVYPPQIIQTNGNVNSVGQQVVQTQVSPITTNKETNTTLKSSKPKLSAPFLNLEIDKYNVGWDCVSVGQNDIQTVSISNKSDKEIRCKAEITEDPKCNYELVFDVDGKRDRRSETYMSLKPQTYNKLKINFKPAATGPAYAQLTFKFHSIPPKEQIYRSQIPLIAFAIEKSK